MSPSRMGHTTTHLAWGLTIYCFLVLVICLAPASGQRGAMTVPRNLSEMVDEAGLILRGQVVSAKVEPHPDFPALWTVVVTLRVEESLKGTPGNTYTFRQFIWDPRDRENAAGYRPGRDLLLLLVNPSVRGLSSPVGLEQGQFQITSDSSGKLSAINGRNNLGLLRGVAVRAGAKGLSLTPRAAALVSAEPQGPIALNDLRDLIRQLAGGK
jgi:hypothetical protein